MIRGDFHYWLFACFFNIGENMSVSYTTQRDVPSIFFPQEKCNTATDPAAGEHSDSWFMLQIPPTAGFLQVGSQFPSLQKCLLPPSAASAPGKADTGLQRAHQEVLLARRNSIGSLGRATPPSVSDVGTQLSATH